MALLEQDHAFEIADALIAASEADETEVTLESVEDRFVRFAHEGPTQSADRERYEVGVRVRYRDAGGGFREARACTGGLDEESVFGALARAVTLAEIASADPDVQPLGGPVDIEGTSPSRPTQDHSFREKAEWIRLGLDGAEAQGFEAAGLARTSVVGRSLVNSAGRRAHGATSRAEFSLTCTESGAHAETNGSSAASTAVRCFVDQIDAPSVVDDAVSAAAKGRNPAWIEAAPMTVVLAPQAVSALLSFAAYAGFGAREVAEGSSFMSGRIGEAAFDPRISIVDDPAHPLLRGWRFDGEGHATGRTELVRDGVFIGPVTDARWAKRLGLGNTGHSAPQPSPDGPLARSLVLEPGDADFDELVAEVGDGLFIRQLHYVNVVEPQDLVLTGMTRGGTFRIRDGQIAEPVRNLRFTQSLVAALQSVVGVGSELERQASLMGSEVVAPALALRDFRFTSVLDEA